MCFAPQRRAIFWHQTSKKWSEPVSFLTFCRVTFCNIGTSKMAPTMRCFVHFDLQMCFAPQPRAIFSTSELQKWLRQWGVLCILTCKCASRHGGVPFLNIGTSKMSPTMRCFVHFDLQMCFAPQRACHFSPVCQNSYLRTRRFSEATFRTSGTTNHWKNTAIRDVPNIFHTCTFFLVTLHACVSPFCGLDISSLLDTSTLLFNSAYCRKLDFYTSFDYCS